MNEAISIHLSQLVTHYEGTCTFANDLMYSLKDKPLTAPECREYLERKIKQLDKKLEEGNEKSMRYRGYKNQRLVYKSILNYLTLHKIY